MEIKRLFEIPYFQLENFPNEDALAAKVNGKWEKHSTQEFLDKANQLSRALVKLGIKKGDTIAMISNNRPEWNMVDIGIMQTGAVDVPVYPTISSEDYAYIFNHAEVKICFVSDQELYDKVKVIRDKVASLQEVYSFEKIDGVKHWSELLKLGNDMGLQEEVDQRKASIDETDLATLIYTSGTTGKPKGVMLSHKNLVSNVESSRERIPVTYLGKALSFLPLCHVYERMITYLYMRQGISIYYAETMETIGENLKEVKPEVFTAVPRLLEKVYDKIVGKGADLTGIKKKLFFWALDLGLQYDPEKKGMYLFKLSIARKLIFSKWKEALGGNVQVVASGSAALQPRLARVFCAAGIPIMEGYGLTETSPVISVNNEEIGFRIGSVGTVLSNVEVKIAKDGEILTKGPNLMLGYYKDEEMTKSVIDNEGWFHTGDIGELKDGFLKITDRKKEIFKTSGGKYIAPQVMENKFKESRFIEQLIVVGENQKFPSALVVPAFPFVKDWCKRKNIPFDSNASICENKEVYNRILEEIKSYNQSFGNWEQVKKIRLISEEWSVDSGELTPTLKLKRKVIMAKYGKVVEDIYN